MDRLPQPGCRLVADHLARHVLGNGGEQKAADLLIFHPPRLVRRVGDDLRRIVKSLGDSLRRSRHRSVEVTMKITTQEVGQHECAPEHEILPIKMNKIQTVSWPS